MIMTARVRKVALTAHVTASVGWLGAVIGVLALAIAGMASQDEQTVRGAYLAMNLSGWYVLVPLSLASLLTGLIQSLGTTWGLVRHYWVIAKLVINVLATIVLLAYTQTLGALSGIAAQTTWSPDDLALLGSPTVIVHASGALVLLLAATFLAIFKPRGMTNSTFALMRRLRPRPSGLR
jgi:hypothetical protein